MKKLFLYIDVMHRGGAQRVMMNLIAHFLSKGWQILLVTDYPEMEGKTAYAVPKEVQRIYLHEEYLPGLWKNFAREIRLRRLLKTHRPDVALSFLGGPNIRFLIAGIGLKGKRVVSVRNDPNREYGRGKAKKAFTRTLFRLAHGCVFQTEEAAAYFPKAVQDRSQVIMNPVDARFYEVQRSDCPKDIISLGRLSAQKNQAMLIEAFSKIASQFPEEALILYGEGELRETLQRQIAALGLEGRVLLPGAVSDVEGVLSRAKLFVMSSDFEGMPNALMEAMAAGVPSISTDCPCGGPRVLLSEECLTPIQNSEALAERMREFLAEPALREQRGREARAAAERFRTEKILAQWEAYLTTNI